MRLQKYNFFLKNKQIILFLPQNFIYTLYFVQMACIDEQEIGQAVDERDGGGVHGGLVGKGYDEAFGTAAHGAAHVALGGTGRASGKDEGVECGERGIQLIDAALQ